MITKVILYTPSGLMCCKNRLGLQAPSLGGSYPQALDKILAAVDKDAVEWIVINGKDQRKVSFDEFVECGRSVPAQPQIPVQDLDVMTLRGRSNDLGEDMTPEAEET